MYQQSRNQHTKKGGIAKKYSSLRQGVLLETFLGRTLRKVEVDRGGIPLSFYFNKQLHRIVSIHKQWHDFDFSPMSPRKNWKSRRHRNYYQVVTETGQWFEIYCDRGTRLGAPKTWVLVRELGKKE